MGLFDKLFSGSDEPKEVERTPWINITSIDQLDEMMERSKLKTQLIFKHSTRCGISRMVIGQFKKDYQLTEDHADIYYLDLIANRDISNAIANRLGVVHESPQLIIIKNGTAVANASHGRIHDLVLVDYLT